MKIRIIQYNLKCPKTTVASDGRDKPLTREYILSDLGEGEKAYDRLGQMVPPNLPGTKKYWSKEYLDLAAFCQRQGVPDYFITLTANDSWPDLKNMLDGAPPHFRPAESILFFMQRFRAIKPLLWGPNSIFGRVTDHWYRIEFQNRGSPHVHLLLWVDQSADKQGKVVATVPRSAEQKELRAMVLKYQKHSCIPGRCYKKDAKVKKCKYGFPYDLLGKRVMKLAASNTIDSRHQ